MKFCPLLSLLCCLIPCHIAADWRNCPLVIFAESAAVSASICELISHSADAASGKQFTGTWQGTAIQTISLCALVAKFTYAETYPELSRDQIIHFGLISGPFLKTAGSTLWQHITRNVDNFNSFTNISSDNLLARHRPR
jgi:hypothetical protein